MRSALIFVVAGVLLLPVLAAVIALTALLWRMSRRDQDDGQD
jgi:integral membrane sensor domain MASE1